MLTYLSHAIVCKEALTHTRRTYVTRLLTYETYPVTHLSLFSVTLVMSVPSNYFDKEATQVQFRESVRERGGGGERDERERIGRLRVRERERLRLRGTG